MKKLFSFLVISIMLTTTLVAQKNTIVTIDGRAVSKEEFENIYQKNNTNLNDENEVKSPKDYMKMFIDFKLKVIEAENRGLDTTQSFINELAEYRNELAKTYLTDVNVTDSMVKQAYYRTANLVKVNHILISLAENASPEDTLKIYNKMIEIRNMYLNKEKTFDELAKEYSEDPSSAKESGSLPYFSAFKMIKPFEDVAFTTKIGEVSMPFRTRFGYHILKVIDLKPSRGEVKVAHIMKEFKNANDVSTDEDNRNKVVIDSVYKLLQNGSDYGKLAQEISDDKQSGRNNGEMNYYISEDFAVKDFADAAFNLQKIGDYSKPIRTKFGWHIIKLIDRHPVLSFEEMQSDLTKKVKGDPTRNKQSKTKFIENLKKEYGFTLNDNNFKTLKELVKTITTDTLYQLPEKCSKLVLFRFAATDYTSDEYFTFILNKLINKERNFIRTNHLNVCLDEFIEQALTDYENIHLEDKYPEFKYLIKEYHDGILLFSIMESEVWNKAIDDSLGLTKYYDQNKGKYQFDENFDGLLITCVDADSRKIIEKSIADGITNPDSLMAIANKDNEKKNRVVKGRWEKGSNRQIDYFVWKAEKPDNLNEELQFTSGTIKNGGVKTLDEARGLYISDYQAVIEKEWLEQLRKKYVVKINEPLLRKVKSLETKR
jgi:peptidyl-prolyl cis-trans isomerase SurA